MQKSKTHRKKDGGIGSPKVKWADRIKDEFISLASHQLRTPLSVIKWYSEILESDSLGELNPAQLAHLRQIKEYNQHLIDLVEGLLSVARIDQGKIVPLAQEVNLEVAIGRILSKLGALIKQKRLRLAFPKGRPIGSILIDPQVLDVILQNLITNAVDYSDDGGEFGYDLEANGLLVITVWDKGCGIPREEQPHLYEKFFRGSNARRMKPNGTGLGLYMVKMLVEAAGGAIGFESHEGKGTKFVVSLPYSPKRT